LFWCISSVFAAGLVNIVEISRGPGEVYQVPNASISKDREEVNIRKKALLLFNQ
jgi:hypothetical protein